MNGKVIALTANTRDPAHLAAGATRLRLTLRVPPKTQDVRVMVVTEEGGQIGTADVNRAALRAAPAIASVRGH